MKPFQYCKEHKTSFFSALLSRECKNCEILNKTALILCQEDRIKRIKELNNQYENFKKEVTK